MYQRFFVILLLAISLLACTGLETDNISEEIEFKPNWSLPLGKLETRYDEVSDLPFDLPDPIDSEPISWSETDTVFFSLEASVAERKYIVSMLLQFDITNAYPAEMALVLYYIDPGGRDVLLTTTPILIEAAEINEAGELVSEKQTMPYPYQLPLSDEMVDALLFSERLVISATIDTLLLSNEVVAHFSSYSLSAAVGVQAQIDYSINNF